MEELANQGSINSAVGGLNLLFNSLEYLIFYPIITVLYFILPQRARWVLLLAGSYYFYMAWRPEYIILILASTLIAYITGLKMGSIEQKEKRKKYLYLSLFINLGLLAVFKYFNFFNINCFLILNHISIDA